MTRLGISLAPPACCVIRDEARQTSPADGAGRKFSRVCCYVRLEPSLSRDEMMLRCLISSNYSTVRITRTVLYSLYIPIIEKLEIIRLLHTFRDCEREKSTRPRKLGSINKGIQPGHPIIEQWS